MAYTVLSVDPGSKNFAASVLQVREDGEDLRIKVLCTKLVHNTVHKPMNLVEELRAFQAEIYSLEFTHGPFDLVVAERFQSRGLKGTTIESINMMLGALAIMYPCLELYTASTWKNSFNRAMESRNGDKALNELYEDHKQMVKPVPKAERRTIHELDSSLMGIYHSCKKFGVDPFYQIATPKKIGKFLNHWDKAERL